MDDVSRLLAELASQVSEIDHTHGMHWAAICIQAAVRGRTARHITARAKGRATDMWSVQRNFPYWPATVGRQSSPDGVAMWWEQYPYWNTPAVAAQQKASAGGAPSPVAGVVWKSIAATDSADDEDGSEYHSAPSGDDFAAFADSYHGHSVDDDDDFVAFADSYHGRTPSPLSRPNPQPQQMTDASPAMAISLAVVTSSLPVTPVTPFSPPQQRKANKARSVARVLLEEFSDDLKSAAVAKLQESVAELTRQLSASEEEKAGIAAKNQELQGHLSQLTKGVTL